jgi:hypothetical protein
VQETCGPGCGVESLVHGGKPFHFPIRCMVIIKTKSREGAVDLQRLPDLSCPLGPDALVSKMKICQHGQRKVELREGGVEGQRLRYLPCLCGADGLPTDVKFRLRCSLGAYAPPPSSDAF